MPAQHKGGESDERMEIAHPLEPADTLYPEHQDLVEPLKGYPRPFRVDGAEDIRGGDGSRFTERLACRDMPEDVDVPDDPGREEADHRKNCDDPQCLQDTATFIHRCTLPPLLGRAKRGHGAEPSRVVSRAGQEDSP